MIELMAINGAKPSKGGQVLFDTFGTFDWVVPVGVTSICSCAIATGLNAGAGGGLAYRNNIPVTEGETLTVIIPNNADSFKPCGIKRGEDLLVVSYTGNFNSPYTGGLGGKNADLINDGGGNGGNGTYVTLSSTPGPVGGGAGGYSGNGGNAPSQSGQGGGGGGGVGYFQSPNRYFGAGGGTGIIKQGPNGAGGTNSSSSGATNGKPGSNGVGQRYGGGRFLGANIGGAVRIIWGRDRSYPLLSDDIVE